MPQYVTAVHGDRRRYLVKALREVGRRITRMVPGVGDRLLNVVPEGEESSIASIVGYLRDAEREDQRALEAMLRVDGSPIAARRAEERLNPGPGATRGGEGVADLLWDFATLREETLWILESAGGRWNNVGIHPFRGEVDVLTWVQEMSERDLDAMWRIQHIRDLLRLSDDGAARQPDR
ncbi:MAG: hypothetical protein EPO16_12255 [Dehalococcoidia bacterium]|nr:MAG: hypothetical protein EPO16_12255 [Dehalococcoidia bacterium]